MSFFLKDPDAVLDYSIDWGSQYLDDGDIIATSEWTTVPDEGGGLSIVGSSFDATTTRVKAAGGAAGKVYRLVNRVTTESGRSDDRSIVIRVESR